MASVEWLDKRGRRRKPRNEPGRPAPVTCWQCDEPALDGRAVCRHHADALERRAERLRAKARGRR